ncbi:MAG: hypothetical protein K5840_01930 [Eubacterium sp.]|nr:hypothetical protein [Eubacterium sp.]
MNRVLMRRYPREIRANFFRYAALFALIVFCMYIITAIVDAAEIVMIGTVENQEASCLEDGQFTVFSELTSEQTEQIEALGVTLEPHISFDIDAGGDNTVRIFKNREIIDTVTLDEGRDAAGETEAVLEKRYCEENGISVGDTIVLGSQEFTVTGIGSAVDYDAPFNKLSDTAIDSSAFGVAFVTEEGYELLQDTYETTSEDLTYAFLLDEGTDYYDLKELVRGFEISYEDVEDEFYWDVMGSMFELSPTNLMSFMMNDENPRIGGAYGDISINRSVGMLAGIIVIVLVTYVLSVFVIHQIQSESSVIGALYAMGVRKKDLMRHYILLPTIIALLGGALGAVLGFSELGVGVQSGDAYDYYSIPQFDGVIPAYLVVYSVLMPPAISLIINYLVINRSLSRTALSLIKNEQAVVKSKDIKLGNMPFMPMFRLRQLLRERRTAFTVIAGMFISLLIFMLGLDTYVLCSNVGILSVRDTTYEYMYTYKYPTDEVPEGGEACFIKSLKKEQYGYILDVSLIGIDGDNPYMDFEMVKGKNKVVISDAVAIRYGLSVGDKLVLSDNAADVDYAFTVEDIVEYSVGLSVFMDIDSMRELFGESDDYYNVVLSDTALDIDEDYLYSVNTKADTVRASDLFVDLMRSMFITLITVAGVIFFIVMYLMTSVMIDRGSMGISLFKIFGFRTREVKRMYLDGNRLVVILGALIGVPASKCFIDWVFPMFIANVACCIHLEFPWYYYVIIFAAILLIYQVNCIVITRKLDGITPAEILKNRE